MKTLLRLLITLAALGWAPLGHAEVDGTLQILLLGDSTTEAKIPKLLAPQEPQFEDLIRTLLAAEGDLPPTKVINAGLSGEWIRRLLDTGRYGKEISKLARLDYILVRYGLNDHARREGFEENFPQDFRELLVKLRADHPQARIILMTVIPYKDEVTTTLINTLIRRVAEAERLELFDVHPRYAAELKEGPNMLNYRRFPLAQIPEKLRPLAQPYVMPGKDPMVVVLDNRLDAHFGQLPGWFADRHPNLAGYHVLADETAKYLAPLIRAKGAK